jgi:hypothetical protein
MIFRRNFRAFIALLLAANLACPPLHALVSLNDSHDKIYVTGSFGVSHDSNVFAAQGSAGDFVYSSGLTAEYARRAGWIGVNGSISVSGGRYGTIRGQDFNDPSLSLEFTKQTGRTTGSITLAAARESRADAAVNTRTSSWNYNGGLNARYHLSGTYDLTAQFAYSQRKYLDDTLYTNLSSYSAGFDLFHVLSTERDIIAGYRYRYSDTTRNTGSADHAFTAGVHGKVVRGVNGTLRLGYQFRETTGAVKKPTTFSSWTANGTLGYALTKRLTLSGNIAKDFSTTASDASVDTLSASLEASYALNSHWSFSANGSWTDTQFLGESGRVLIALTPIPVFGPNRHDNSVSASLSANYSLNEHLKTAFSYSWFRNWSTIQFADFDRSSWSLTLSSRW